MREGVRGCSAFTARGPLPVTLCVRTVLQDAKFQQLLFKFKVAEETYQDEARVKVSIFKAEPLEPIKEGWVGQGTRGRNGQRPV